jgi:hypothetical protein
MLYVRTEQAKEQNKIYLGYIYEIKRRRTREQSTKCCKAFGQRATQHLCLGVNNTFPSSLLFAVLCNSHSVHITAQRCSPEDAFATLPIFPAVYAFPLSFHFHRMGGGKRHNIFPFSDQIKPIINLFRGKSEGGSLSIKGVDVFLGLEEVSVH